MILGPSSKNKVITLTQVMNGSLPSTRFPPQRKKPLQGGSGSITSKLDFFFYKSSFSVILFNSQENIVQVRSFSSL